MGVLSELDRHGFGEVHIKRDAATGLRAIIAIHDTRLGPALGGSRFVSYASDDAALVDALRLARGMTYKAAITGLPHGGGKSVLVKPEGAFDRAALFRAFGRFVEELGGRYITAEDSGTSVDDMEIVRGETRHVTGLRGEKGGGDPSPFTALGVRRGIEACVKHKLGKDSLAGLHVAIQGVGHVGYYLAKELKELGCTLTVADIDSGRTDRVQKELGAKVVAQSEILGVECDVLAPCALGAILNDETLPKLRTTIVAGGANNQLAEAAKHGDALHARGILYAPDYAINAGGLVNVAEEYRGYDRARSHARVLRIYDTILEIAERSAKTNTPTWRVSDTMAEERLAAAG